MEEHPPNPWTVSRLYAAFFEYGQEREEGESDFYLGVVTTASMDGHGAQNDLGPFFV